MTDEKQELKQLLAACKKSVASFGAFVKASKTGSAAGDELAKLATAKDVDRQAFNAALAAFVGDTNTDEGQRKARDWGFYAQKSFIFGVVGEQVFRYVDPRYSESLRLTAVAYVEGHKLLGKNGEGWTIEHGVNPLSVKRLVDALGKALESEKAKAESDPERIQQLTAAWSGLKRHAAGMLAKANTQRPQQERGKLPTLGQQLGPEAVAAVREVVAVPAESGKKGRPSRSRR